MNRDDFTPDFDASSACGCLIFLVIAFLGIAFLASGFAGWGTVFGLLLFAVVYLLAMRALSTDDDDPEENDAT